MDVHDGSYAELPLADSWTDFFSAVQDEHPVPAPAFTAHSLPQQQQQQQQARASQYVAPEPVAQPRESCSVDKLVQRDIINRIQQVQERSALLSFKELVQYQRAKKLKVLTDPIKRSRAESRDLHNPLHPRPDRRPRKTRPGFSPPPGIFPAKPPSILRLASSQVDLRFPFCRPSIAAQPQQAKRMPALAELRTPLRPDLLPPTPTDTPQAAAPTENLAESAAATAQAVAQAFVPPAAQPPQQLPKTFEQMLAPFKQALQPSGARGVLGEMNQLANEPQAMTQQQPEAMMTQQAQLPQHLEGQAPISPLRRR